MLYVGMPKEGQDYDAGLLVGTGFQCNLKCVYCFPQNSLSEHNPFLRKVKKALIRKLWRSKSTVVDENFLEFTKKYFPEAHIQGNAFQIDTPALLKVLEKTGKTFHIIFTGGEPFMAANLIDACRRITGKHFVSVVTNLTDPKVGEFCRSISPRRVISIYASTHVKDLEKMNLIKKYIDHYLLCRRKGFQVIAQAIAYPPLAGQAANIMASFRRKGVPLTFSSYCGVYDTKQYPAAYSQEELKSFGISQADVDAHYPLGKPCNAGYNFGFVALSGEIETCFYLKETLGNIYDGLKFKKALKSCPVNFCNCPFNYLDRALFMKTVKAL